MWRGAEVIDVGGVKIVVGEGGREVGGGEGRGIG